MYILVLRVSLYYAFVVLVFWSYLHMCCQKCTYNSLHLAYKQCNDRKYPGETEETVSSSATEEERKVPIDSNLSFRRSHLLAKFVSRRAISFSVVPRIFSVDGKRALGLLRS